MILKQIKFDEQDLKAAETVRLIYGCDSFSQAVRLATRIVAANPRLDLIVPPSPKTSNVKRELISAEGMVQLPSGADLDALDAMLSDITKQYGFHYREPAKKASARSRATKSCTQKGK